MRVKLGTPWYIVNTQMLQAIIVGGDLIIVNH